MKKFLKNNWGRIILFIILSVICILSFSKGKYLLGNDNYSPELNPSLTIERSIESPAWRSYRVLGFGSESEQSDVFRSVFFWIAEKFLPQDSLGQVFGLLCLFLGSWFMGELTGLIIKDFFKKKYSQLGLLLGGIIYVSTLWTVWTFYQNLAPFTSNFGFLPLLLFSIYLYVKDPSNKKALLLFISSLVFTSSCVIATLFISDLLLIIPFVVFLNFSFKLEKKERWRRFRNTFLIFGVTQLFWILPFIFYTFFSSGDLVDSYINRSITSSIIDLESEMQTITNSSRFYTRILTEMRDGEYMFPLSLDYQSYDFYKVIGLFPVFASILSIIFAVVKKKWKLLFFPAIALIFLFLIKGINPPLGNVFTFFQESIPLFKQVFRWVSSKLGEVYLIPLTISSVLGTVFFWDFIQSFMKEKLRNIIGIIVLILFVFLEVFYANYLFTNNLYAKELLTDLPDEYFSLGEYLEHEDPNGRIYYAPSANNNYFREYDWGFYGSQFISYIIPNPMMDMSLAVGSGTGEDVMLGIQNIFRSGDYEGFNSLMNQYNVEYVLIDRNLVEDGFTYDIDWEIVDSIIANYDMAWSEGDLELYVVPESESSQYLEYLKTNSYLQDDYFVREESIYPKINFLSLDLEDISIGGNNIIGSFEYIGNDYTVMSNIEELNWGELPTGIRIENSKLIIYPVSPTLSGYYTKTPQKIFDISGYQYISVKNHVFAVSKLNDDVYINDSYNSISEVFGTKDLNFVTTNLTNILSQSTGYNCKDEEIIEDIKVLVQEGTSGFSLSGEGIPCIYQSVPLDENKEYIFKIKLNWETSYEDLLGFCLYSENEQKCLNQDKYLHIQDLADEEIFLISRSSSLNDNISLIIYTLNIKGQKSTEVFLRNVSVEYASLANELNEISSSEEWNFDQLELKNGEEYSVEIPILAGKNTYSFNGQDGFVWQSSPAESEEDVYEVSLDQGMIQEVQNQTLVQSNNLFTTNPLEKYLVFWNGENISNIPAEICLSYKGSNECWIDDLFTENIYMQIFESGSTSERLDVIYQSISYNNETENILKNFGIMEIPQVWEEISMAPSSNEYYEEYEMKSLYNSPSSTMYKVSSKEISKENVLLSIPQKESSGWIVMVKKGNSIKILNSEVKVVINGWKQAWDISSLDYDTIYVIYWPNLLGYLGYILILTEGIVLTVKLFKKEKHE